PFPDHALRIHRIEELAFALSIAPLVEPELDGSIVPSGLMIVSQSFHQHQNRDIIVRFQKV
ncbi:MAG: hypothetical protein WAM75_16055, partial [Xanthobacteraceae bacterium]